MEKEDIYYKGMLFDLKVNDTFRFKNKSITYAIVAKGDKQVTYRRIQRTFRNDKNPSEASIRLFPNRKVYQIDYTQDKNIEVFDFLEF